MDTPAWAACKQAAAATLSFLPSPTAVLVSGASWSPACAGIAFLRQASELCPTVLLAQTKIDLYPQWQRIVDLNRGHLSRAGIELPIAPVSACCAPRLMRMRDHQAQRGEPLRADRRPGRGRSSGSQGQRRLPLRSGPGVVGWAGPASTARRQVLDDPELLQQALADLR